jgi:FtsH-binding integral membrane protein
MQQSQPQSRAIDVEQYGSEIQVVFSQVYLLMTLGLVVTAIVAAWVSVTPSLLKLIYSNWWVSIGLMVAQIALVIVLSAAITRLSTGVGVALFLAYAALLGVSLSAILLYYTQATITMTFMITAGTFGVMSIFGFVTKRDLTKLGNLMIMLLIGLILGSVVNIFLRSSAVYWILTYVGVGIFVGLIAYDTQKIKQLAAVSLSNEKGRGAIVVMGALKLYLDFINLFLLLLRIFGRQR